MALSSPFHSQSRESFSRLEASSRPLVSPTSPYEITVVQCSRFNFDIHKFQTSFNTLPNSSKWVSINGKSGIGKSTLLHQLIQGSPEQSHLLSNGQILTSNNIGYCPQKSSITTTSVFSEIIYGRDFSQLLLDRVIRCCLIDEFLSEKPLYSSSKLSLSGGQLQRIALARSLYGLPNVLILDEATNSLPPYTESLIFDNIRLLFPDLFVLATLHRLENQSYFDHSLSL